MLQPSFLSAQQTATQTSSGTRQAGPPKPLLRSLQRRSPGAEGVRRPSALAMCSMLLYNARQECLDLRNAFAGRAALRQHHWRQRQHWGWRVRQHFVHNAVTGDGGEG